MFCARDRMIKMTVSSSALRRVTARAGRCRISTAHASNSPQIAGGCGLYDNRRHASSQHQGPARGTSWRVNQKGKTGGGGDGGAFAAQRGVFTTIAGRRAMSTAAAAPTTASAAAAAAAPAPAPATAPSPAAAFDTDLLVVGCGIAGAASALQAARLGMRVTMLSSAPNVDDCNSFWAQGGIIYKAEDDSPDLLASDVHTAGAGICNDSAVMKLAEEGPGRVEQMLLRGTSEVPFDRDADGHLALCLEASHNRARIIHWRDETGKAITTSVQAAAAQHPNIRVMTSTTAVDLALAGDQCVGAHVLVEVHPIVKECGLVWYISPRGRTPGAMSNVDGGVFC